MCKKMILVVGRTASGKDTFVEFLENRGFKAVLSYTTRERRNAEDRHIFITEEEADNYKNRAAETIINGYQYFTTVDQLDSCDVYVIDPTGLYQLIDKYPNRYWDIVYITSDFNTRKTRYINRANKPNAEREFMKRHISEDAQFKEFSEFIKSAIDGEFETVNSIQILNNSLMHKNRLWRVADCLAEMYGKKGL